MIRPGGVGGNDALDELGDEDGVRVDLAVGKRDPLVDECGLFRVRREQGRVGGKGGD